MRCLNNAIKDALRACDERGLIVKEIWDDSKELTDTVTFIDIVIGAKDGTRWNFRNNLVDPDTNETYTGLIQL